MEWLWQKILDFPINPNLTKEHTCDYCAKAQVDKCPLIIELVADESFQKFHQDTLNGLDINGVLLTNNAKSAVDLATQNVSSTMATYLPHKEEWVCRDCPHREEVDSTERQQRKEYYEQV